MPDVEALVGQVVPAISAAVGAYGVGVLTKAEDETAAATVRLGQRFLTRILHRTPETLPLEQAVGELATAPNEADALAALRLQIRKVLAGDSELAAELVGLLPSVANVEHGVAVAGNVRIEAQDHSAAAWSMGSVSINNPPEPGRPHS